MNSFPGLSCGSGEFTVCHKDIAETISGITGYAKVCNDGKVELMKVPVGYVSPRKNFKVCLWEVRIFFLNQNLFNNKNSRETTFATMMK